MCVCVCVAVTETEAERGFDAGRAEQQREHRCCRLCESVFPLSFHGDDQQLFAVSFMLMSVFAQWSFTISKLKGHKLVLK